jgi:hypothetical protein
MMERGGAGREGDIGASASGDEVAWRAATPAVAISAPEMKTRAWDMGNIGSRIGADAVAAASAGVLVAPIITIIDR